MVEWHALLHEIMLTKHRIAMESSTLTNFCAWWKHLLGFTVSINGSIHISFYLKLCFLSQGQYYPIWLVFAPDAEAQFSEWFFHANLM
jgi:hypothetical protein